MSARVRAYAASVWSCDATECLGDSYVAPHGESARSYVVGVTSATKKPSVGFAAFA